MNAVMAHPSRRQALQVIAGASLGTLSVGSWAQAAPALGASRLIVIFLRGAYDGLSAFVPYADPHYSKLRNVTAIAAPDGSAQAAIRLDAMFGLHPALAPLLPLWQQGLLTFLPASGSPDATRSHFEAQHHWEIAQPGKNSEAPGWLNSLALLGQAPGALRGAPIAVGVGEANPRILAGPAPVQLIPGGQAATRQGALANDAARNALLDLYSGPDELSRAFRQGASSRMQTAQTLGSEAAQNMTRAMAEMNAADNGAANANGLPLDTRHLVTLMQQNRNLRLGFLSAGGWDTHANQGGASGQLANNFGNLARALTQLRREFSRGGDLILVASEFGRTCQENGTRGTDHGHGNAMWLIGERVNGGRWHGQWDGLAPGQLNEGRDLPVHHDFRAVLAQALARNFGLADSQLADLLPGAGWDASLDRLFKS
jgi:uncharacterized protein (DUF1501 family)